jgi:geranylgeranyl pyrophosphate synthase
MSEGNYSNEKANLISGRYLLRNHSKKTATLIAACCALGAKC